MKDAEGFWGSEANVLFISLIDLLLLRKLILLGVTWQGVITEDVTQLRKSIWAPGMAVLQFGKYVITNQLSLMTDGLQLEFSDVVLSHFLLV